MDKGNNSPVVATIYVYTRAITICTIYNCLIYTKYKTVYNATKCNIGGCGDAFCAVDF